MSCSVALSFLSDRSIEQIEAVVNSVGALITVFPSLNATGRHWSDSGALTSSTSRHGQICSSLRWSMAQCAEFSLIRAGNIASGNHSHTQALLSAGVLEPLLRLAWHETMIIRKDVCWTLSNITAGQCVVFRWVCLILDTRNTCADPDSH
jgi:hypothetical protein